MDHRLQNVDPEGGITACDWSQEATLEHMK